jgi:predicted phosphodiesterase
MERMRARFPNAAAVVFGHSHIPLHEERDGFQIFNPGSPTDRRRAPRHTMGMARAAGGRVTFEHVALD